jgi:hypothetical protein
MGGLRVEYDEDIDMDDEHHDADHRAIHRINEITSIAHPTTTSSSSSSSSSSSNIGHTISEQPPQPQTQDVHTFIQESQINYDM